MTESEVAAEGIDRGRASIVNAKRIGRGRTILLAIAFLAIAIVPALFYASSLDSVRAQVKTQSADITALSNAVTTLSATLARDELAVCKAFHVKCPAPAKS